MIRSVARSVVRNVTNDITSRFGGAVGFALPDLYASGESGLAIDLTSTSNLFQDAARSIPAVSDGDPVGGVTDQSGNDNHLSQGTASARPLLDINGSVYSLIFDGSDDILATPSITGFTGGCVAVIGTNGMWIDNNHDHTTGVFEIGDKSGLTSTYTGGPDNILDIVGQVIGIVVRDTALNTAELASLKAFAKSNGSPGYYELGSELVTNGDISSGTIGYRFDAFSAYEPPASYSASGGQLYVEGGATNYGCFGHDGVSAESAEKYIVSVDYITTTGRTDIRVGGSYGNASLLSENNHSAKIGAGNTGRAMINGSASVFVSWIVASGESVTIDNLSLKKLTLVPL